MEERTKGGVKEHRHEGKYSYWHPADRVHKEDTNRSIEWKKKNRPGYCTEGWTSYCSECGYPYSSEYERDTHILDGTCERRWCEQHPDGILGHED